MNLSAMSMADLMALQDALALVQQAGLILSGLPNCGEGDLVIQMRPGEAVTVVTSFVMPVAGQAVPAVEPVLIEEFTSAAVVPVPVSIPAQAKAAMQHAATILAASDDLRGRSEEAVARAEAIAGHPNVTEQPAANGDAAGKAGGGSGKMPAPRVKVAKAPAAPRVTGPFTEFERQVILSRMDRDAAGSIALDLNRRVQDVSMFIHGQRKRAAVLQNSDPAASSAVVVTGGPEAAVVAPDTGPAPAAAEADLSSAAPVSDPVGEVAETVEAPRAAVVEIVPPAPPPSPAIAGMVDPRPARHRAIGDHIDRVKRRAGFDAEADLELVEALARGDKLPSVAADFGMDSAAVKARWEDLTRPLLDLKGRLAVDDQQFLLIELRRKVREARSRAA